MNLQGLGAVAAGINQGITQSQNDALLQEQRQAREQDRAFQQDQRMQWKLQTDRTNKASDALEQAKAGAAALPAVGSVKSMQTIEGPAPMAADGSATPIQGPGAPLVQTQRVTEADNTRALANLWRNVDPLKSMELDSTAKKQTMSLAAEQLQTLRAGAKRMSLPDYARALGNLVHGDDSPLGVTGITPSADGKSVRATVFSRQTGLARDLDFNSHDQLTELAQAHYDPTGYAAFKAREAEAAARAAEKQAERPVVSVPGGYYDTTTKKFVRTQFGSGEVVGHTADGEPIYGGGRGGGRGGGGKGGSGNPADPDDLAGFDPKKAQEQATAFVDKTLDPEGKLTPQQRAREIHSRYYALRQAHAEQMRTDTFVDQAERILRRAAGNPKLYADQYEKMLAAGGNAVAAELARRGITAPKVESKPSVVRAEAPPPEPERPLLTTPGGLRRTPAVPGSPQARWEERQAAARQQMDAQLVERQKQIAERQKQFDERAANLEPEDLVRAYQDFSSRQGLRMDQLQRLKTAEERLLR